MSKLSLLSRVHLKFSVGIWGQWNFKFVRPFQDALRFHPRESIELEQPQ